MLLSETVHELLAPPCLDCKHLDRESLIAKVGAYCTAFPQGIPDRILQGLDRHREPYPGDHGIRFEAIDTPAEAERELAAV